MKIWGNPGDHLPSQSIEWVDWLHQEKKREPKFDLVIEIVENYVPERIVLFVGFGLLGIVVLAAAWLVEGGNPGNVTTVMGFVLGVVTSNYICGETVELKIADEISSYYCSDGYLGLVRWRPIKKLPRTCCDSSSRWRMDGWTKTCNIFHRGTTQRNGPGMMDSMMEADDGLTPQNQTS
jgi:hypothetical protein